LYICISLCYNQTLVLMCILCSVYISMTSVHELCYEIRDDVNISVCFVFIIALCKYDTVVHIKEKQQKQVDSD